MMSSGIRPLLSDEEEGAAGGATMTSTLEDPIASSSRSPSVRINFLKAVDWESYISNKNRGNSAPTKFFKQLFKYPENQFQRGMRVEVNLPFDLTYLCQLAKVESVQGPRLKLRPEGEENDQMDFWRLVDSEDIHPVGYSERRGCMLKLPSGVTMSVSAFIGILPLLEQDAQIAPSEIFVTKTQAPRRNRFKLGMLLEAVVRAMPHLIWPAIVGAVNNNKIKVAFDDGQGKFNYWCQYDSRDIFPVGWCEANGHPLGTPEQKVCVFINDYCKYGPYLDASKIAELPVAFTAKNIEGILKQSVQALVDAAHDQKLIFELLPRGSGNTVITAQVGTETLSINLPALEKTSHFWNFVKLLLTDILCCKNFYTAERLTKCNACEIVTGQLTNENSVEQKQVVSKCGPNQIRIFGKPAQWSVDDVIQYMTFTYPALEAYADLFRKEQIDGQALLMLNVRELKECMGLPMGIAVKIHQLIQWLLE